jgi:selenocysteine lyase/cysteine desulfurase
VSARLGDRSLFPGLEGRSFLNHAGVSPPSLPVREAAAAALGEQARGGAPAARAALELRNRLRTRVAELVGGRAEDVALLPGLSAGVQTVALCFPWTPGDRVLLFEGEFPANVTPWQRAAALHGLRLGYLPLEGFADGSGRGLEALEAELRRGARMVAVSAVQFRTGLGMPLAEMAALAAGHGAEIFVDAIQACGAVPLDAAGLGLDYLACGAHKWLMGIQGTGFLWVRPGRARDLQPHLAGWLSHEDPLAFLLRGPGHLRPDRPLRHDASALEPSSPSLPSQAALLASLEILLGLGVPAILSHAAALCDRLEEVLRARGFESLRAGDASRRSAFFSARLPAGVDGPRLRAALAERGVVAALPDGLLRLAPHWPNAPGEAEVVAAALDEAIPAAR